MNIAVHVLVIMKRFISTDQVNFYGRIIFGFRNFGTSVFRYFVLNCFNFLLFLFFSVAVGSKKLKSST